MIKIVFAGHDFKFLFGIISEFEKDDYEVRTDQWSGHATHDEEVSKEMVAWADIIFCEWGLGNVIWYQNHKRDDQKLFVRMHRFEMNTEYPSQFNYSKIDTIIAISPYIFEEFHRVSCVPRDKMQVIYNSVQVNQFDKLKKDGSEFNIGIVGIVPSLKRFDRALDILEALLEKDTRYKLYVKGQHPQECGWVWNNSKERKFYDKVLAKIDKKFKDYVIFEGWGDVSEWLQDIGYVLSVSDYESFHLAPIEGMASGAIPLILDKREGVRSIFPEEFIFESIEEIVGYIISHPIVEESLLKGFVKDRYNISKVYQEIVELIHSRVG